MPGKRIFQKTRPSFFKSIQKAKKYCSRLYKKEKKKFNNLNPKLVSDHRLFWKTVKPLFSSKGSYSANIKLTDDEIIQKDEKYKEALNSFFRKCCF